MSWMLRTKRNAEDDQIRKKPQIHWVDMKQSQQVIQGSRGATEHSWGRGTQDTFGAFSVSQGAPH